MLKKSVLILSLATCFQFASAETVEGSKQVQKQINEEAVSSQKKINVMADEATQALQAYRAALQRAESLQIYNAQLQKLVSSQSTEMASIVEQTEQIEQIEMGVLPLMVKMVDTLDKLVATDTPFLIHERTARVENLKTLIDRADVSIGEKYRRIMEAYNVEMEYGKTIEAYTGEIVKAGQPKSVDFLRIGRVGLYYQSLDGKESGRWDKKNQLWTLVDASYRRSIRDGLRVARKQAPPELLTLPVAISE
ncbi:DUF3450 domain-containing protein [Gayadomonas joobiniege]|uniref:DUF3450 domain-containing protein n=1 Tax=Gayadomonas joobiniege TaxID=1234606 RepID=UPI000379049E|nr:DUF3450 domain-containing protein [Gayadomonas joobiniege]